MDGFTDSKALARGSHGALAPVEETIFHGFSRSPLA